MLLAQSLASRSTRRCTPLNEGTPCAAIAATIRSAMATNFGANLRLLATSVTAGRLLRHQARRGGAGQGEACMLHASPGAVHLCQAALALQLISPEGAQREEAARQVEHYIGKTRARVLPQDAGGLVDHCCSGQLRQV